ncbi:hypothetical protein [Furfurilactobacillus siliginis]|uniref:Uncharacterized protein n=1 Tax=Furfurilactobacillus siliginis TaxID=348151 RepID=A0A0R2L1G8_9LACO|nr:hypothetical protein [Furfurilactobacillus siliginis]KRN95393.1 hypothetical protein IV55_GL002037 [Furfurilactobacillus siliginis]GEK28173.1 hypothetical protein LSI01_04840 [Furfurilactobacillus siliginis]
MEKEVIPGAIIRCQQCDDLQKPFLGKVLERLHQRLIVQIINFDPVDRYMVDVLGGQVAVSTQQISPLRMIKINVQNNREVR